MGTYNQESYAYELKRLLCHNEVNNEVFLLDELSIKYGQYIKSCFDTFMVIFLANQDLRYRKCRFLDRICVRLCIIYLILIDCLSVYT